MERTSSSPAVLSGLRVFNTIQHFFHETLLIKSTMIKQWPCRFTNTPSSFCLRALQWLFSLSGIIFPEFCAHSFAFSNWRLNKIFFQFPLLIEDDPRLPHNRNITALSLYSTCPVIFFSTGLITVQYTLYFHYLFCLLTTYSIIMSFSRGLQFLSTVYFAVSLVLKTILSTEQALSNIIKWMNKAVHWEPDCF